MGNEPSMLRTRSHETMACGDSSLEKAEECRGLALLCEPSSVHQVLPRGNGPIMLRTGPRDTMPSGDSNGGKGQKCRDMALLCEPTEATILDPSGSTQDMQRISSLRLTKHKVFLSHAGAEKNFVEQLCVDLERQGYAFPFFDQRSHSLPKGDDFVPLIKQAAQQCHVAVMVLSHEFLRSKWPMIELAEFHSAQQAAKDIGCRPLKMLPVFFKLQVGDLADEAINKRWMPIWREHERNDKRINVQKWYAAVKAMRAVNSLIFEKLEVQYRGPVGQRSQWCAALKDMKETTGIVIKESEVEYRRAIVKSIVKMSPPDFMNGSSRSFVGYDRLCEKVSNHFVKSETNLLEAEVLGLFGMSGVGKTQLSLALCDYFSEEYSNKTCHVELGGPSENLEQKYVGFGGSGKTVGRQKVVLKRLCGVEDGVLDSITNADQGWKFMQDYMTEEPVFLVIDNVADDEISRVEVVKYLMLAFNLKSKIMITSRSRDVVLDFFPEACMPMPCVNEEEASIMFLEKAAPLKNIFSISDEERTILQQCIEACRYYDNGASHFELRDGYHPLALAALGDSFSRISNNRMLHWKEYLENNQGPLMHKWKFSSIFSILELQFNTFQPSEQLLFLDMALYTEKWGVFFWWWFLEFSWVNSARFHNGSNEYTVDWLSQLHDENPTCVRQMLQNLRRSGMIVWKSSGVEVPELYKEFAEWYVTEKGSNKNRWCAYHTTKNPMKYLVRLRMFGLQDLKLVPCVRDPTMCNLVLLQLDGCTNLKVLNLQGLNCLRHLNLFFLPKLMTIIFHGDANTDEDVGIFNSLQHVEFWRLSSLMHAPDFKSCTSLRWVAMGDCFQFIKFERIEWSNLKMLCLSLVSCQLQRLPNFRSLTSLEGLVFYIDDKESKFEVLDLSGLEYCKRLVNFSLNCFGVPSILGLAGLTQLRELLLLSRDLKEIPGLSCRCPLGRKWDNFKKKCGPYVPNKKFHYYYGEEYPLQVSNDDVEEGGCDDDYDDDVEEDSCDDDYDEDM